MAENKNKIVEKIRELARICKELSENYKIESEFELSFTKQKYHVSNGYYDYYDDDLEKALDKAINNFEHDLYVDSDDENEMYSDYARDKYREWASY